MSSPSDLVTRVRELTVDNIKYKPAKVNSRGGKNVSLTHDGNPLVIQFPLILTWGVNENVDENTGRVSYSIPLQFGGRSSTVQMLQDKLQELQDKILDDATSSKCKEWFGKSKMSREVAEAMMYPILKFPKVKEGPNKGEPDYDRSPTLKLKIPYWNDEWIVELYDMDKSPVYLKPSTCSNMKTPITPPQGNKGPGDIIPKGSYIKGLLECTGVWTAGGRFGVTWKLVQANVRPPVRLLGSGTCHVQDDSDDDEALEDIKRREEEQQQASGESKDDDDAPTFDDSDDEEEEVAEPEPEPAPKKKKKVVRRKKKAAAAAE